MPLSESPAPDVPPDSPSVPVYAQVRQMIKAIASLPQGKRKEVLSSQTTLVEFLQKEFPALVRCVLVKPLRKSVQYGWCLPDAIGLTDEEKMQTPRPVLSSATIAALEQAAVVPALRVLPEGSDAFGHTMPISAVQLADLDHRRVPDFDGLV